MPIKRMTTDEYFKQYGQMPPIRREPENIEEPAKATRGFSVANFTAKEPTPSWVSKQVAGAGLDVASDFMEMGKNITSRISERSKQTSQNIARRQQTEKGAIGELGESFGTGLDWATDTIRGAAIVVEEAGMFGIKAFLTDEQEKAAEQAIGRTIQSGVEAVEGTQAADDVKKIVAGYNKLKDENPEVIGAAENVVQIVGTIAEAFGIGKGTTYGVKAVDTATEVIKQTAPKVQQGVESAARATGEAVDTALESRRASQLANQEAKVETAVGRILQAGDDPRAIEQATRALSDIDTSGIKTYDELNDRFTDRITALSQSVDERLANDSRQFTPEQLTTTTKVGEEVVSENPVRNALDGLENAYEQSGEPTNAARIRQLNRKYEDEGLTLVELNDLAREYGIEFKNRAFTKLGEPKQGYNADRYENTRKAVKQTLRDQMPDDVAKQMDAKMSDIYSTLDLTRKVENTVAKLEQRIKNRTLAQKAGGAVVSVADLATGGMLRGAITKLLPSNVGNKSMNAIEIQSELRKNLKELQRISNIQNPNRFADELEEWAQNAQPGMSIRSTVRPDKVAKDMDKEDFQNVTKIIDNPDRRVQYTEMLQGMGLQNATDEELVSFLKEVVNEFEGVAEREVIQ